jgi:hypothetical protein
MSRHPIFIRINRDCMHRKLVGRAEDTDGNFLETDEMEYYVGVDSNAEFIVIISYPAICDKDLCQGPAMARRLAAHGLNRVHRRAWCTGAGGKDGSEPGGMKGTRHGGGTMRSRQGAITRLL